MLTSQGSLRFLAASCLIALGLAPLQAAFSAVPTLSVRSATLSSVQSLSQLQAELPKGLNRFISPLFHLCMPQIICSQCGKTEMPFINSSNNSQN